MQHMKGWKVGLSFIAGMAFVIAGACDISDIVGENGGNGLGDAAVNNGGDAQIVWDAGPDSGTGSGNSANPDDPFGACLDTSVGDPSFACSQRGAPCAGGGHGHSQTGDDGYISGEYHVMCDHRCDVDADCPVPETGDSRPVCQTDYQFCQLPCDPSTICPDGYTCQPTDEWLAKDGDGNPIALPFLCMQTITVMKAYSSDAGPGDI